jgi:holo-[acyl-carrier protein] synthase
LNAAPRDAIAGYPARVLVLAHGIDLVHVPRLVRVWERHGKLFLSRVYTSAEQAHCLDNRHAGERLAGRFAVKEAVFKALGTGWRGGIAWTDVETLADELGKPCVRLAGRAAELAAAARLHVWLVSISHAGEYATASVLAGRDSD